MTWKHWLYQQRLGNLLLDHISLCALSLAGSLRRLLSGMYLLQRDRSPVKCDFKRSVHGSVLGKRRRAISPGNVTWMRKNVGILSC